MVATGRRRSSTSSEPAMDSTLDSWPRTFAACRHMNACGERTYAARVPSQRLGTSRDIPPSTRWSDGSKAGRSAVAPVTEEIAPERLVAIVRTGDPQLAVPLAEAIVSGGISTIEVALTTPRALEAIAELVSRLAQRGLVGAGTVRNASDAESAIAAGAGFLVSPDFNEKVLGKARSSRIPYIPGALTPSEVGAILDAGVETIKIFPAARLGPGYLRDLLGPFPQLRPIPTGGIDFSNAADFMTAGAFALGIGSALTDGTGRSGLAGVTARTRRLKRLMERVDGR